MMAVTLKRIDNPVVLRPVSPPPAYVKPIEFRTIAASIPLQPEIATLLAMDDSQLSTVLFAASIDIDSAMRYQGEKYDARQPLEFPRRTSSDVWDWQFGDGIELGRPVFPYNVKLACVYQAAYLQNPKFAKRLENIRSGLASHSIGTASESYVRPADLVAITGGGFTALGDRPQRIMEKYRLTTGRIL